VALFGGAIYFECDSEGDYNCILDINEDTYFHDNAANSSGGAIYWRDVEPNITNATYSGNSAVLYGDDIAAFARQLAIVTKEEYEA